MGLMSLYLYGLDEDREREKRIQIREYYDTMFLLENIFPYEICIFIIKYTLIQ